MRTLSSWIGIGLVLAAAIAAGHGLLNPNPPVGPQPAADNASAEETAGARTALTGLDVKGRAPKTGYSRAQFGLAGGWPRAGRDCDTRDRILARDLTNSHAPDPRSCNVTGGVLHDPYTAATITLTPHDPNMIQIDHRVALSDAWQKGAQQWTPQQRAQFAIDPDNLLAVDGLANAQKKDSDAATWLPPNRAYRCTYAVRQIIIKDRYRIWVTPAEKTQLDRILTTCPRTN